MLPCPGSGRQWMSWIHRDDLVGLIIEAATNPAYSGTYNATAPKPVRMSELCGELGAIMGRPSWLPVPDFALQTLLGEGANVVLEGQCVLPARTRASGGCCGCLAAWLSGRWVGGLAITDRSFYLLLVP
jgi:uncharacterized protein